MTDIGNPRRARARKIALIAVLSIAAFGLLYRMLRPFWEEPTTAPPAAGQTTAERERVELVRVIDGDTIEVRWRGGRERVRLLRIDTPERGDRGYREATAALATLLGDETLELVFERPGRPERDRYDRLLAYVLTGGENANVELVRLGWSRFWTRYGEGRLAASFVEAEREAAAAEVGLWGPDGWNQP
jgi:micrococcal nuclease